MDKADVQQIVAFFNDVQEGLCEGDEIATMQAQLTEIYCIIEQLMTATAASQNQAERAFFASLEYRATQYKADLEARLGTRN